MMDGLPCINITARTRAITKDILVPTSANARFYDSTLQRRSLLILMPKTLPTKTCLCPTSVVTLPNATSASHIIAFGFVKMTRHSCRWENESYTKMSRAFNYHIHLPFKQQLMSNYRARPLTFEAS
jgi:hypothetical protein